MKGWIKVHIIPDDKEMNIRSADISTVGTGVLKSDETKEATCISLNIDCCSSSYAVTETVEEVFALIEEAENGEEKNGLLPLLTSIKAECGKYTDCNTCRWYKKYGCCQWKRCFYNLSPIEWDLDMIPEEYR